MDWTAGYASDVEYTAGFYREQSPTMLNMACLVNGYEPVPLDRPFTYFELGFGRGLTINLIAAASPNGKFYAADFNPAHVAGANQLAQDAELDNLTLLENSFEELAAGKVELPQFDFVTLHGIYTWVTAENRAHIVSFLNRYLKPGGIVYVSYNALPGWSAAMPLQRLLVEHADLFPDRSDRQVKRAVEFAGRLAGLDAAYFSANAGVKKRLDGLDKLPVPYLVHEYMHHHWQPLYHADVARDFMGAKLDYVGSVDLPVAYPSLMMSKERLALLDEIADSPLRQTLGDFFLNTSFRKDVFVRGARKMTTPRQRALLAETGIALQVPKANVPLTLKLAAGEVKVNEALYLPVLDELSSGPKTLGQLAGLPQLQGVGFGGTVQIAAVLIASGGVSPFMAGGQPDTAASGRMNRVLGTQTRFSDELGSLVSPLLGSGVALDYASRLVCHAVMMLGDKASPTDVATHAWKAMEASGRRVTRDGQQVGSEAEAVAEIERQIRPLLAERLPIWRQLGIL